MIEFTKEISSNTRQLLIDILPPTITTKVVEEKLLNNGNLYLKLYANCRTVEDAKSWIEKFQDLTCTSYSVNTTKPCTGRYCIFKQYLKCQHNTRNQKIYDASSNNRTRNTNCPSSIVLTVHAVKKRFRGKNIEKFNLVKEMPCEIDLIVNHNHSTRSVDAMHYRKVSTNIKEKLLNLYKSGHSPTTALEMIKLDIIFNYDDYEDVLADRKHCPDYMFCYHLYVSEFKKEHGPLDSETFGRKFLAKKITDYNEKMEETCAAVCFEDSDYVICICPPLLKRVHQYCESSSEMVFMDSTGTGEHGGSRLYVMLTHAENGGLPVAVIISSSESTSLLTIGFQLLEKIMGKDIFGSHPEGPLIFITRNPNINTIWPRTRCLWCPCDVLQSIKKWLEKTVNNISSEQQTVYFYDFKRIIHSETVEHCILNYETARSHITNQNYLKHFEGYWEKRELWSYAYRNHLLNKANNTDYLSESLMILVKDKICNRTKAFNIIQLVDFMLTKFISYYEMRLLYMTTNHFEKNFLGKTVKLLPSHLQAKIQVLNNMTVLVPSASIEDGFYMVELDALMCTCINGKPGQICQHLDWACNSVWSEKYCLPIDNKNKNEIYYRIATGIKPHYSLVDVDDNKILESNEHCIIPCDLTELLDTKEGVYIEELHDAKTEILEIEYVDEKIHDVKNISTIQKPAVAFSTLELDSKEPRRQTKAIMKK